ncbi:hypothetical protein QF028_000378 [Neobacillus sp. B4I6]|uniref:hypothetical protein n=1 Tax=Neobacillus sp. B4I6 TaxID=3373925 RepID=UPI003D2378D6
MIIPQNNIITNDKVPQDPEYKNLRIVRYQSDRNAQNNYNGRTYQFQHEYADYTVLKTTISRKGGSKNYRLVASVHPNLKTFVDIVRYDPADPPIDDYYALGMKIAHDQTQSDFKGQKKQNALDFKNYLLEGIRGHRTLYLPPITGWQAKSVFDKTIFVSFDESDPNAMYGELYLPKRPIMQADGQTQTAALFQVAKTIDAINAGALESLVVTLEIELNVSEREAGQSFADRNGRGSKKNKNLVINLDTSSALSRLRADAIEGTVFQGRIADGRTTGTSETATSNIVDLSTMEQMLLNVISNGRIKQENFKHHHIEHFLPYAKEFISLLDELFAKDWLENTPRNLDPFRKLYTHGWPFVLKALAKAYHQSRLDVLAPLAAAIGTEKEIHDASKNIEEKYIEQVALKKEEIKKQPDVNFEELKKRLQNIDWLRYRKHWISLTGYKLKDGKKKTFKLKNGEEKVVGQAQNTPTIIDAVTKKILSNSWEDLCKEVDEPLK